MIDLRSDNTAGVSSEVMAALAATNGGTATPYSADELSERMRGVVRELFETNALDLWPVFTGTAANMLALAALCPPWGGIVCHRHAHILCDENTAPEMITGGARLLPVGETGQKLTPDIVDGRLRDHPFGSMHAVQPALLSLTDVSEWGRVYTPDETAALAETARRYRLKVHVGGARFANAVVATGASPADLTWRAGVDALSLGATKGGCMAAELLILFGEARHAGMAFLRKRAGQVMSKGRYMAAQLLAWLEDDHWLDLARHANREARALHDLLACEPGIRIEVPVEANLLFPTLDATARARLAAHATFYDWLDGTVRMVCAFDTDIAPLRRTLESGGR
jgi:threonine aldolase